MNRFHVFGFFGGFFWVAVVRCRYFLSLWVAVLRCELSLDRCGFLWGFFGSLWAVPCFSEEEILNKILIAQILNHKDGYVLKYLC